MPGSSRVYDVAIVGAGPAGSATAFHLARAGLDVALFDRSRFPRDKPCAEYLSPGAEPLLRELGVLDELEHSTPAHLKGFRVVAPDGSEFQGDFSGTLKPDGCPAHTYGLAIPRFKLDRTLVAAAHSAGAEVFEGWRVSQAERTGTSASQLWRLVGGDLSPIRARVLVAADGVHSTIARRLDLHRPGPLHKIALVAHLRGIEGLSEYGEVHVSGRRYVGLAPLEPPDIGDLCNVALVVDAVRERASLAGRPEAFLLETLATFPHLRGRLANVTVARPTLTTSGMCVRARRVVDHGLLLVGDAAGYFDPFTGEGIFQALTSASLAAGVITDAIAARDISARALAPYAARVHEALKGKRAVEAIIQSAVHVPAMMDRIAHSLARRKWMADTVVAVTGDYLPPARVLHPGFLLRLLV